MDVRSTVVDRLRHAGCVYAEDEARLILSAARDAAEAEEMLARRAGGLPLEYVVGFAEFCGRRIAVEPGVFVPRRRTEFLVHTAAEAAPRRPVVLDLCCGTGALGVALAGMLDDVELHAADVSPAAVRCARRNVDGRVYQGDLFEPLPTSLRGRVDVLLCNVPYVPSDEIALLPAEAREHEPRESLDGGADGLDVLRRVAAQATTWLAKEGRLLVETSERQAATAAGIVTDHGLRPRIATDEELGATVLVASRWGI